MARAYVAGDLRLHGVHPGDPYEALELLQSRLRFRKPTPAEALSLVRGLGLSHLQVPRRRRRRSTCRAGAGRWRGCGTR